MLRNAFKIDENNCYAFEQIELQENEVFPEGYVDVNLNDSEKGGNFYVHKWNGVSWEEGLSPEEIDEIKNNPPPKSELEIIKETVDQLVLDNLMRGF